MKYSKAWRSAHLWWGFKKIKAQHRNGRAEALSPTRRVTWAQALVVPGDGWRDLCPFSAAPGLPSGALRLVSCSLLSVALVPRSHAAEMPPHPEPLLAAWASQEHRNCTRIKTYLGGGFHGHSTVRRCYSIYGENVPTATRPTHRRILMRRGWETEEDAAKDGLPSNWREAVGSLKCRSTLRFGSEGSNRLIAHWRWSHTDSQLGGGGTLLG